MSENGLLSARDYALQIDGLIERSRYAQARVLIGEALAHYPDDHALLFAAACVDYNTDAGDQARRTLQQILARDPEDYAARSLMVSVLQDAGELPQAELLLIELIREYPEAGFQYARYALLMYRTLHIEKAQALAREAFRLDPNNELALTTCLIGDIIDGRKGAEQAGLARLLQGHPESENTARMLITHLISRGRYKAAKRIAVELLKLYPSSREVLELVVQLDALSHWSMLPLWPLNRWGWAASAALYVITLLALNLVRNQAPLFSSAATWTLLGYCAYSWIYPSLLTRWLKRRAGL
ncbi:tetratricopeptide (TPR) repeat protein [Duganella sp. 3397]|uniref:tetratricopeptide repeat protein n=1 Tax=Duganella sp. 3397 TaxID=2817732 RepID=UPI00285D2EAC|nr:tetratricopeptide repeat protein [Duganella sp. 3397]MDR7048743.1 tetratricopeptide (TPR) repeat protein [Duganella sp. 3397]